MAGAFQQGAFQRGAFQMTAIATAVANYPLFYGRRRGRR